MAAVGQISVDEKRQCDFQSLKGLLEDEQLLDELLRMSNEFNVFDVMHNARHEIRHSKVLAWLLNPNESHNVGRAFFDYFVRKIYSVTEAPEFLIATYLSDEAEIRVDTEIMSIDILVTVPAEKIAIAIENKTGTKEHDAQLIRYRNTLETIYKDCEGWRRFYFYLTPAGDPSKDDPDNWSPISYEIVVEALKGTLSRMDSSNQAKQFVHQYCKMVEREVMNQSEIEELCRKIYRRHAKALNLIQETIGQGESPIQAMLSNTLESLENDGKIVLCRDKGHYVKPAFHTKSLDKYFGTRTSDDGSWGNKYLYVLWFERRDPGKVKLYFEVGPYQTSSAEYAKIDAMAKAVKFKRKISDRYCRIWCYECSFNAKDTSDVDKFSEWIKAGVDEVLQQQDGWIETAQKELEDGNGQS
ncbi:MAG: PD-(D/E)XK nuclease family protein [Kiritimatiellae bacterium]|nr:PD-(D/E)XK nuclease family protein [Kiritimatiellia bacterium]